MSWLLDTDVLCEPAKRNGNPRVIAWLERKEGRQREILQAWLTRLIEAMQGRIHGFNVTVAHVWAEQEHLLEEAGKRMPVEDGYIAATARRHGLTIVTGNDKDFRRPGLKVFNPFKEDEPLP
jgi:predicted nucleic acid-binding protein